jgi:hypothetical protein
MSSSTGRFDHWMHESSLTESNGQPSKQVFCILTCHMCDEDNFISFASRLGAITKQDIKS